MQSYIFYFDYLFKNQLFDYMKNEVANLKLIYDPYSGSTLNPNDKTLTDDINNAGSADWVFVKNIDFFNAIKTTYDYQIIIVPEFVTSAKTQNFRILNYSVNIDYNPIYTHKEAVALLNSILNLQDLPVDGTKHCIIGTEFKIQDFFEGHPDSTYLDQMEEITCILFTKPTFKKVQIGQANYLRYNIDLSFMFLINVNATLVATCIEV